MSAQGWLVAVCVVLAMGYMVRSGVAWLRRVRSGGSACGGCSGEGCASVCGTAGQAGTPMPNPLPGDPAPVHWHPAPPGAHQHGR